MAKVGKALRHRAEQRIAVIHCSAGHLVILFEVFLEEHDVGVVAARKNVDLLQDVLAGTAPTGVRSLRPVLHIERGSHMWSVLHEQT